MARSAYDPAISTLDNYRFAGGSTIGTPGAPAIDNTPNPYAAMAGEMVGEIAYNAGAEYMAPEGEWNEELGKMVYTKKPFGSIFGDYTIPEDAIWGNQLQAMLKSKEIEAAKEIQARENAIKNREMNYQRSQTFDVPTIKEPVVVPSSTFIEDNASSLEKAYVTEPKAFSNAILKAAQPYKASFFDMWTPDFAKKQDDKLQDNENEEFMRWANNMQYENGAGAHFAINSDTPNYEAFKLYEANPLEYWRKNIKTQE